jgi:hypothetical protein
VVSDHEVARRGDLGMPNTAGNLAEIIAIPVDWTRNPSRYASQ